MKVTHKLFAGLAVAGLAVTAVVASRPMPAKVAPESDFRPSGTVSQAAAGLNYATGFEAGEGFAVGWIGGHVQPAGCGGLANPCWNVSGASLSTTEGHIDTVHPAGGSQHLRVAHDPSLPPVGGFNRQVDARYPDNTEVSARPTAPNTVSLDVAVTSPFGQDFRVQPQTPTQAVLMSSALFFYSGALYILDDLCGATGLNFFPAGSWDTTGAYQNYTVATNPCLNTMTYFYGGNQVYAGCVIAGTGAVEQYLVFGDNYPGSDMDNDNLTITSEEVCPSVCGNGIFESPPEQCEPGDVNGQGIVDCNPGHTCDPTTCQCSRTCTLAEPCVITNGANGPFYGPFDAAYGGIFIYDAPAGVDAVSVELCGSTGADQRIFYWGSCSDPADPGSANDDCYPGYSGADPSASCYGTITGPNYESCTCHDNPLPGDNCYLLQIRPPSGAGQIHIEVNKKSVCGQGHLGSCCDTNGLDVGCTDNVLADACMGADKVWTENGKCADQVCECIPMCEGRSCGDDGCGGQCQGVCDDSNGCTDDSCDPSTGLCVFTPNSAPCDDGNACTSGDACAGGQCAGGGPTDCNDANVCTTDGCDSATGCTHAPLDCNDNNACTIDSCDETTPNGCVYVPRSCDNGVFCDGAETCNPSSGCVPGTPPTCDDGVDCTADSCDQASDACVNDDSDCSIPTVSEWGLVVLALMLLIGAKVYFGRRQAIA